MTLSTATQSTATQSTASIPTERAAAELCRAVPDALGTFFSEELTDIAEAKRLCAVCPVIVSCLEGAMRRAEPCGVWGGQLFDRGRIVRTKRRRGRPPKHPRAEDEVPDLPIPEHLLEFRRDRSALLSA